jgi:hypothetical protein
MNDKKYPGFVYANSEAGQYIDDLLYKHGIKGTPELLEELVEFVFDQMDIASSSSLESMRG